MSPSRTRRLGSVSYGEGKSDGCIGTSYELCYLNGMALTSSPTPCRRSHVAFRNSVSPHPLGRFVFLFNVGRHTRTKSDHYLRPHHSLFLVLGTTFCHRVEKLQTKHKLKELRKRSNFLSH